MKLLVTKWFATVLLEDGKVARRVDFPRDARSIAQRLLQMRRGEVLEEERQLASPGLVVHESRLKPLGRVSIPERFVPVDQGDVPPRLLREAALLVARDESRRASGERDRFVVQSVRALDEVTKTVNTLMERLRDWYALHFPEVLRHALDPAKLAQILADAPGRDAVAKKVGGLVGEDSVGAPFTDEELGAVQTFARTVGGLFQEWKRLEPLIEQEVRAVAPTLSHLVGPMVAARLIAQANGLERLAHLPSSTVQTLGAEDALFSHLKEKAPPPKHGILFQHPLVNTAPYQQRGRIARILAGHAAIAARLDHFGAAPQDRSEALRAHVETQVQRIRKAPPRAPGRFRPRRPGPAAQGRGDRRRAPMPRGRR